MDGTPNDPPSRLALRRAHVPAAMAEPGPGWPAPGDDGRLALDIVVEDGRVAAVGPHDPSAPAEAGALELAGRMVWPCPVDVHTHLDKGHIWPRAANPDGTFEAALAAVGRDREARWSASDVRARMEFALRCAFAHGTRAVRTHLDCLPPQDAISWPVFADVREAWAGRVELQGVSLAMPEHHRGAAGERLADRVREHGGVLGLVPQPGPGLDEELDRFLALASERGLDADLHVDETLDPAADALRHLARAVIRNRFPGRVVAGHCCSLSVQPGDEARRTLDLVAEAGIAVVSLPMCNIYLQDRERGRTPRRRGVTVAHEIRARGIPLAFASDNTRDPFYAYGDLDMHEVFREAVRIAHLDHPFGDWPAAVSTVPAGIMGLAHGGRIAVGAPADLVIFEGRSWTELLARPESRRIVLRAGKPVDTTPPPYAELDHLFHEAA
jgi:cytosine/creatinine deaminase